ncbi:MAG: hypothetical protein AB1690_09615 [Candidatus Zixiibacteriota bacterium]
MPLKFNKSTDEEHKEKLEPSLITATWKQGFAIAGQQALFEVFTAFVGNGAEIKVTGKSENGDKLGKIKDTIFNNCYVGKFDIPDDTDMDDLIYFEIDFPKNGISGESNRIPVYPPVKVTNMKWSAKEARRGDVLTLSAEVYGVKDKTEATVTIYEYDRDGLNDRIVELPVEVKNQKIEVKWEYQYFEDTDEIPSEWELQEYGKSYNPPEYFFTVKLGDTEYGKKQESGLLLFKDWIEVELLDSNSQPVPNQDYILRLPDGTEKRGQLDGDGKARVEDVPPGKFRIVFPNWEG